MVLHNSSTAPSNLSFLRAISIPGTITGRSVPFQTFDSGFPFWGNRVLPRITVGEDTGWNEVQGTFETLGFYHVQEVVYGQFW
jgi:hypothetical protein